MRAVEFGSCPTNNGPASRSSKGVVGLAVGVDAGPGYVAGQGGRLNCFDVLQAVSTELVWVWAVARSGEVADQFVY